MTPNLGIEPGSHWWEASALTTAPSLHPRKQELVRINGEFEIPEFEIMEFNCYFVDVVGVSIVGSLSNDDGYGSGNATKQLYYPWLKEEKSCCTCSTHFSMHFSTYFLRYSAQEPRELTEIT